MPSPETRAQGKSQLFQLIAQAFSHPSQPFYQRVVDGSYSLALNDLAERLFGASFAQGSYGADFADYESQYIDLFHMGKRGVGLVCLNSGDYDELLDGQPRPEFMLQYSSWYKYFGVKVRQSEFVNEQPDHMTCQLEFMAWLAELESSVDVDSSSLIGYQRAQRDFIQRHFQPFLTLFVADIQQVDTERINVSVFVELAEFLDDAIYRIFHELNSILGPGADAIVVEGNDSNSDASASVNLWG